MEAEPQSRDREEAAEPMDFAERGTSRSGAGIVHIATDYLVVGAGAAALAFVDTLLDHSDAEILIVDRRAEPGGHWNDAYPFVRLHQPSAFYGVDSRRLGGDAIVSEGRDAGEYERATGPEVRDYFHQVMSDRLLRSGRVRFLPEHEYQWAGGHRIVSLRSGDSADVAVRRKLVDATYLETSVPATHTPSFDVAAGVRFVAVNALAAAPDPAATYVLIGAGKTAMDACTRLLDAGIAPRRIRWIRARDPWLLDRAGWQPLQQVGSILEGAALDVEAAALAQSLPDLFRRLEASGRLLRLDDRVEPTMYRCAIVSRRELAELRRVTDVVRLGRIIRIEPTRIVLVRGEVPTDPGTVHVDCSAVGIPSRAARPIFQSDRITMQPVRHCSPSFNAALLGYVEATRSDPAEQNRLCPPNPYPSVATDWARIMVRTLATAALWSREPDLRAWIDRSRLNSTRGAAERMEEPRVREASARFRQHVGAAVANLQRLLSEAPAGDGASIREVEGHTPLASTAASPPGP